MNKISSSKFAASVKAAKQFRGRRRATVLTRLTVLTLCFALAFSGFVAPGPGMAQTANPFVSLKEVPVPVPMAVVFVGRPIPGPNARLTFKPLTADIVKDQAALIRLGKALFWDMQVGSDGMIACATCHYNAGADNRSKNQISPGVKDSNFRNAVLNPLGGDNSFGNSTVPYTANDLNTPNPPGPVEPAPEFINVPGLPQFTPNYQLTALDFPLNGWFNPTLFVPRGPGTTIFDEFFNVDQDTNDVVSSMGIRHTLFKGVTPGSAVDSGTPAADIFNTAAPGQLTRQKVVRRVEPRNAPTVINAVFNYDNFWDGRASFIFNGVNPFGFRDQTSTLKVIFGGVLKDAFVRITNSSLASQAVGPPGSNFEMSFEGRSFPDIGRKMLSLRPLAKQLVHPNDSVLGAMARATISPSGLVVGLPGLNVANYKPMIRAAFKDRWWASKDPVLVAAGSQVVQQPSVNDPRTVVLSPGKAAAVENGASPGVQGATQYTQMEYNFSLFFGLAVQAYEATLISDDTPFDRFMGAPTKGIPANPNALTFQQRLGLSIYQDADPNNGAKCVNCHVLPITTGHTVLDYAPDAQGVPSLVEGEGIEFMIMGDNLETANYDHGMYNIAVRRTTEDEGRAGTAPFINPLTGQPFPLSLTELAALNSAGKLPPDVARFVPNVPVLPRRVTNGAFKVPNLRNIKFSGPYFHNGDSATLRQVVEFYARGGNFPNTNLRDFAPDIQGIPLLMFPEFLPAAQQNIQALVAFLAEGLKDKRVAFEKAPFDHPQLILPNGSPDANPSQDLTIRIPPVGKFGRVNEIPTFLNLDPQTP